MAPSILVVDIDRNIRGLDEGYGVLRSRSDLIISDANMPRLDGFDFVEAIRADVALRDIPVIFLTKPVRADHLLSLVEANVPGGRHSIG